MAKRPDPRAFILANMTLAPVLSVPEIRLYTAHPASGLRRLVEVGANPPPPYWAYPWAGGAVLARYMLDRPKWLRTVVFWTLAQVPVSLALQQRKLEREM